MLINAALKIPQNMPFLLKIMFILKKYKNKPKTANMTNSKEMFTKSCEKMFMLDVNS